MIVTAKIYIKNSEHSQRLTVFLGAPQHLPAAASWSWWSRQQGRVREQSYT